MPHAGNKSKKKKDSAGDLKNLEAKWAEFLKLFKDEETCLNTFFDSVGVSLYTCPKCKSLDVEKFNEARTIKCRQCKHVQWVTSGTFFHRIRLPLVWFGTLWLLSQGVAFNANQLHKVAGVAYSTAWKIFKKVTLALAVAFEVDAEQVPSGTFGAVLFRRTCKTPADGHPRDEEFDVSESPSATSTEDNVDDFSTNEEQVLDALSEKPLVFDQIASRTEVPMGELDAVLLGLELNDHIKRLAGGWYERSRKRRRGNSFSSDLALELAARTVQYIQYTFHGVSRKYLQLFVAAHWCFVDRKRWALGALLQHCLDVGEVDLSEIRSYVTPAQVQLFNQQAA